MWNKQELVEQILIKLNQELSLILQSSKVALEAATHEESRAEDKYDTRGLEASYLAGAQAGRAMELQQQIQVFRSLPLKEFGANDAVEPGALVELDFQGKRLYCFMVQQGRGVSVQYEDKTIQVISPQSPLGEELMGREKGDWIEVEAPQSTREYKLINLF